MEIVIIKLSKHFTNHIFFLAAQKQIINHLKLKFSVENDALDALVSIFFSRKLKLFCNSGISTHRRKRALNTANHIYGHFCRNVKCQHRFQAYFLLNRAQFGVHF